MEDSSKCSDLFVRAVLAVVGVAVVLSRAEVASLTVVMPPILTARSGVVLMVATLGVLAA